MGKNIAIIPARGGSKRIPRKNIVDLGGKPMIAWTIEAALNSNRFERVLVSTDDEAIAEVARFYGASVPFLRDAKADDMSTASEATLHALLQAEEYWGTEFDNVTQLMANCPIRSSDDIKNHEDSFIERNCKFQISAFEYGFANPWWACRVSENGIPVALFEEALKSRSQDLDKLYCPTGAIWIADVQEFKRQGTFYGNGYRFKDISWQSATDIDDFSDLEFAKVVMALRSEEKSNDI